MNLPEKSEKTVYRLITIALLAAIGLFVFRIVHAGILALPYPKELLEPSNVSLTQLFLEGKSPYRPSALGWDTPGINYDYPFLNSLIAAAIAKITGCGAVTAHFVLSLFSILISGVIGALMVKKYATTPVTPALSALLFMFCHWRFGYISAAPDDLGLVLMLLAMMAAVSGRIKNKPLVCAIAVTLCFYTKQYFVFVSLGIFIYMMLCSRRTALKFLIYAIVINIAAAVLVTVVWPLYWTYSILFMYLGTITGMGNGLVTFFEQMSYLIVAFAMLFAVLAFAAVRALHRFVKNSGKLKNLKFPENDAFTLCAVCIPVMLVPLFFLGRNDGAFISYFLQLWMPSVVVVTLAAAEKLKKEFAAAVSISAYIILALFVTYFGFGKLPLHKLTADEISDWEKAYSYVQTYGADSDVFYSRGLSHLAKERGGGECICGHDAEAISTYTRDLSKYNGTIAGLFPYAYDITIKNMDYHEMIKKKAENGEYGLITFEEPGLYRTLNDEICEESGYKCIDRLNLQLGNMPYETAFYVPVQAAAAD